MPSALHRFVAAYIRYATHVIAFLYVIGRRFPGFTGRAGSYGIDIVIPEPAHQSRWKTLFRLFLAIPALLLASALGGVAFVIAFLGWWYALVTGRMPEGLRNLGVSCLRYTAQTYAYLLLLTERYPDASPLLEPRAAAVGVIARTRRVATLKTAVGVLALAGLAVGVVLLWPTAVPNDLVLGDVDESAVFGAELVERAERFERFLYVLWVLSQIALLATLWVYARKGAAFTKESAAGPIGTGMLLGMLGLAIVWLVNLPFRLVGHWWALRYDISDADYLTWLVADWTLLGAQFASICLALLIVMGLARRLGDNWWLPGAAVFVGIAALFTFVSPYIDYTTEPLRDEELIEAADRFEIALGLPDVPAYVQEVSQDTEQANAYAYGFGPTRRIVFWDTVLDDPFGPGEQQVVLAHELAHHSQQHLPEGIGWFAVFAVPGAFVLMRRDEGTWRDGCTRGDTARADRRGGVPARDGAGRELGHAQDGSRGRLEGARSVPRPRFGRGRDGRALRDLARRPRPTRLGSAAARNAPGARRPRRDGAGVGGARRTLSVRSACTRAPSRPPAESVARPSRRSPRTGRSSTASPRP